MKKKKINKKLWQFEQMRPLLDDQLTPAERSALVDELCQKVVIWPSGREGTIARSTYYDWYNDYNTKGHAEFLLPTPPKIIEKNTIPRIMIDYGLTLMEEEPSRSFSVIAQRIADKFSLETVPPRSSLYRYIAREERYVLIVERKKGRNDYRIRFEAYKVHYIWYSDAKGRFTVKYADGHRKKVQVLSIIDDKSRAVLAAYIVVSESNATAVMTFKAAVRRWGLPKKFYPDRGSCYDSDVMRNGLALLGVHRINTKPRNPSAHGKIEAYHRTLKSWFVRELPYQTIVDDNHLQELLTAFIEVAYNEHYHREIKMTPNQALNNAQSDRSSITEQQLFEAFLMEKTVQPHRKTGEVYVNKISYKVPEEYRHCPVTLQWDVSNPKLVYLYDFKSKKRILLKESVIIIGEKESPVHHENYPAGSLSPLLEKFRNRNLPQAKEGFGLPEILEIFSQKLERLVPESNEESAQIQEWLKIHGPLSPEAFNQVIDKTIEQVGNKRPIRTILETMSTYIKNNQNKEI